MRTTCLLTVVFLLGHVFLFQGCVGAAGAKKGAGGSRDIPEVKKDCALCHLPGEMKKEAPLLKKSVPELCIECHPDRKAPNEHKVDIVPSMLVKQLPLLDGKLTCITCHDPHQNPYGKMLRVPRRDLCFLCHPY